ncbi:MAG: hypothetical protein KDE34_14890 [Anaerolineales bacterium]|nr:hypothetical protein [Anaerolineales bacterium]MCB8960179.1 hypothetical protein [Ardenticatenales bacterium]
MKQTMDNNSPEPGDQIDDWLQGLRAQLESALAEMEPPPAAATLLGHTAEEVAADPALITDPLGQFFSGLKTVLAGLTGDEAASALADEEISAFQDFLTAQGIELPAAMHELKNQVRQDYQANQARRDAELAGSFNELAAALGQAVTEVMVVLREEAEQFSSEEE